MTLLDAARGLLWRLTDEGKSHPMAWELSLCGEANDLRAAIAREEERQETIDALVEAAREAEVWYVPTYDYTRESGQNPDRARRFRAALARYDAMKEDDRD